MVENAVAVVLRRHLLSLGSPADLVGVTCLARGADTLFAQVVADIGGRLEVIVPSADYQLTQVTSDHEPVYTELLSRAACVYKMKATHASQEAYIAANYLLLDSIDQLIAVWDGQNGMAGGTADVVLTARRLAIPVIVIWPDGAKRGA